MLGEAGGRSATKELRDYSGEFLPELEFGDFDAAYFSPDIVVKGTNLPPRENKDGVCCQWEFSCESQAG